MKGYRNPTESFEIDSDTKQFSFSLGDSYLEVDIALSSSSSLAPVERINIYLNNHKVLINCFLIGGKLIYYFEKEWYYQSTDPRDDVPSPPENICDRFGFNSESILVIARNNHPSPAKFDIGYWFRIDWLFGVRPNPLDTRKSIEKNIFLKIEEWSELPNADIIYQR